MSPSEPSDFELSFAPSDRVVRLTPRLRETYLTPEVKSGTCITQAAGRELFVWVFSERSNIRVALPLDSFGVRRPYEQSIHRWGININRYLNDADDTDGPSVVVDYDGEKPTVEATVQTFDAEVGPDV